MKYLYFTGFLFASIMATACLSQTSSQQINDHNFSPTQSQKKPQKEVLIMNQNTPPGSPSRPAPPQVDPILYNNVLYQQDMQSYHHGGDQPGGYLVAVDPISKERLWMLKVYHVQVHEDVGVSTPGIYFKKMTLIEGKEQIEIESEIGGNYLVDLLKQTSTWLSGPDSEHQ